MPLRVVHVTTAHDLRTDTRILWREARSQSIEGHDVHVVARGLDQMSAPAGITFHCLPHPRGRLDRMSRLAMLALREVRTLRPDVIHFHDPELMPYMWLLRSGIRTVVYDAHEDLPNQMLNKPYLGPRGRRIASLVSRFLLRANSGLVDGVVCATQQIQDSIRGVPTVVVRNFPIIASEGSSGARDLDVIYVGAIGSTRGIGEVVEALSDPRLSRRRLTLVGPVHDKHELEILERRPGWGQVDYLGPQPPSVDRELMSRSQVALCTLHPTPAYLDSLPTKLFEYLAEGVPVIASNFPQWRSLLDESGCAIFVDPQKPHEIAEAIVRLCGHPHDAATMGARGRQLAVSKYSWEAQYRQLERFYQEIVKPRVRAPRATTAARGRA